MFVGSFVLSNSIITVNLNSIRQNKCVQTFVIPIIQIMPRPWFPNNNVLSYLYTKQYTVCNIYRYTYQHAYIISSIPIQYNPYSSTSFAINVLRILYTKHFVLDMTLQKVGLLYHTKSMYIDDQGHTHTRLLYWCSHKC